MFATDQLPQPTIQFAALIIIITGPIEWWSCYRVVVMSGKILINPGNFRKAELANYAKYFTRRIQVSQIPAGLSGYATRQI